MVADLAQHLSGYLDTKKTTGKQPGGLCLSLTAPPIRGLDLSDDCLAHRLRHLSQATHWQAIEQALHERSLTVYDLSAEVIRCDATTVSADPEGVDGGLVQFGHRQDDPSRPPIKLMTASLDPLGLPLATTGVSGEPADDGVYHPLLERLGQGVEKPGLLVGGDGKRSALDIRASLSGRQQIYLSTLPLTGTTAQQMPQPTRCATTSPTSRAMMSVLAISKLALAGKHVL
jgi:transposase